jgi:hypothetical protein
MSEETTDESGKAWPYAMALLVSLPFFYLLSVGPAYVLAARKVLPEEVFHGYGPLGGFPIATGTERAFVAYASAWFSLTGTAFP